MYVTTPLKCSQCRFITSTRQARRSVGSLSGTSPSTSIPTRYARELKCIFVGSVHCCGCQHATPKGFVNFSLGEWHQCWRQRIANRFNAAGEWVGTGSGIHGGIYRWYGSSKTIEQVLAKVADGREEGVSESAVSMASGSSSSGSSTIQMAQSPPTSFTLP
jgi:hypothetical protein